MDQSDKKLLDIIKKQEKEFNDLFGYSLEDGFENVYNKKFLKDYLIVNPDKANDLYILEGIMFKMIGNYERFKIATELYFYPQIKYLEKMFKFKNQSKLANSVEKNC